jgi:hypothetical protein
MGSTKTGARVHWQPRQRPVHWEDSLSGSRTLRRPERHAPASFATIHGRYPARFLLVSGETVSGSQTDSSAACVLCDGRISPVGCDDVWPRPWLPLGSPCKRGRAVRHRHRERGARDLAPRAPCASVGTRVRSVRCRPDGHHSGRVPAAARRCTRRVAGGSAWGLPLSRIHGCCGRLSPGVATVDDEALKTGRSKRSTI